jgi:hypothetical protein
MFEFKKDFLLIWFLFIEITDLLHIASQPLLKEVILHHEFLRLRIETINKLEKQVSLIIDLLNVFTDTVSGLPVLRTGNVEIFEKNFIVD